MVTIKDACQIGEGGLIRPIVKAFWAGVCDSEMFAAPVWPTHGLQCHNKHFILAQGAVHQEIGPLSISHTHLTTAASPR